MTIQEQALQLAERWSEEALSASRAHDWDLMLKKEQAVRRALVFVKAATFTEKT